MVVEKEKISILFQEIKGDSRVAFEDLYSLYHRPLSAFALHYLKVREDAEEIISELFVRIWVRRSLLSNILNPEAYLFVSVKNACLNHIRRQNKNRSISPSNQLALDGFADSDMLGDKELVRLLNEAVSLLPAQRRLIFELIKHQDLKSVTVARILGLSVRTVESQLYKAVKAIAEAISNYLGYDPRKKMHRKKIFLAAYSIFFLLG